MSNPLLDKYEEIKKIEEPKDISVAPSTPKKVLNSQEKNLLNHLHKLINDIENGLPIINQYSLELFSQCDLTKPLFSQYDLPTVHRKIQHKVKLEFVVDID